MNINKFINKLGNIVRKGSNETASKTSDVVSRAVESDVLLNESPSALSARAMIKHSSSVDDMKLFPDKLNSFINELSEMRNSRGGNIFSDNSLDCIKLFTDKPEKINLTRKMIQKGFDEYDIIKVLQSSKDNDIKIAKNVLEYNTLFGFEIAEILNKFKKGTDKNLDNIVKPYLKPATNLTEKTNIVLDDTASIVSIPKKIKGKVPDDYEIVVVCDDFGAKVKEMGEKGAFSHGRIVETIISNGLKEKIALLSYNFKLVNRANDKRTIFNDIIRRKTSTDEGKYIKNLNLSAGKGYKYSIKATSSYEELSEIMGLKINDKNILANKEKILNSLKDKTDEYSKILYEEIMLINKMVDSGIDVHIGAANSGKGTVNMYALSKAKIIVGATNAKGEIANYSSETPLVNTYAQGTRGFNAVGEFVSRNTEDAINIIKHKNLSGDAKEHLVNESNIKNTIREIRQINTYSNDTEKLLNKDKFNNIIKNAVQRDKIYKVNDDFIELFVYFKHGNELIDYELKVLKHLEKLKLDDAQYFALKKGMLPWEPDERLKLSKDKLGKLYKDFDQSGNSSQVNYIEGTSYSTPDAINAKIHNKNILPPSSKHTSDKTFESYTSMMKKLKEKEIVNHSTDINSLTPQDFEKAGIDMKQFHEVRTKIKNMVDEGLL